MKDGAYCKSSATVYSFVCPHCGEEIYPPEGKSLIMRDVGTIRRAQRETQPWKKQRERKKQAGDQHE